MPIRCLIVDDNEGFLAAARALLERQGLTVTGLASTGAEALRQVRTSRPDVILVDIWLREENGLDLARRLVEDDPGDGAAVVLISTRAEEDVADLIDVSPAAGFIAKSDLSAGAVARILGNRPGRGVG